jgi:hypothetical protein
LLAGQACPLQYRFKLHPSFFRMCVGEPRYGLAGGWERVKTLGLRVMHEVTLRRLRHLIAINRLQLKSAWRTQLAR